MSGALAMMATSAGQQVPVLRDSAYSYTTATDGARVSVIVGRNGVLSTLFVGDAGIVTHAPQWGGFTPSTNMGDTYEVRLTNISGAALGDAEFTPANTWVALTSDRQFASTINFTPATYTAVVKLEIRRAGTTQVLATGTYTLTWRQV